MSYEIPAGRLIMSAAEIEKDREAWKRLRTSGVTATDARVLLGAGYKNESIYRCWLSKVDPDSIAPDKPTRAFQDERLALGNAIEPVIQQFAEQHLRVSMRNVGMIQSKYEPILLSNPDRLVDDGRVAEFKMVNAGALRQPDVTGMCTNETGAVLPFGHFVQVQQQMLVGGWDDAVVCALVVDQYTREFHYWDIPARDDYQETIREKSLWLWGLVVEGTPPPATPKDETDEFVLRWPEGEGDRKLSEVQALQVRQLVLDRATFQAEQKSLKESLDYVENQLRILAGESTRLVGPNGKPIFSWSNRQKTTADVRHLEEVMPEIAFLSSAKKTTRYRQLGGFAKVNGKELL